MVLAFIALFMFCGLVGVLVWLGWQRVSEHLRNDAEAKEYLVKHILTPLLLGESEPEDKPAEEPESKRTKGTII